MAEQNSGPVTTLELLAIAEAAPPEIAGRIRRAADQMAAYDCPPSGAGRIYAERLRHLREEGFDHHVDDSYKSQHLALAAACYALPYEAIQRHGSWVFGGTPDGWPWAAKDWKPGRIVDAGDGAPGMSIDDRIRELEKAGALCAAEIDRLLRLPASGETVV